jgi:DNA repair protein RadC
MAHTMTVKTVQVRYTGEGEPDFLRERLDMPQRAAEYLGNLIPQLADSDQEVFGIVALDGRHRLIGHKAISIGTKNQAPVDAQKLFRTALYLDAVGLILFHTHPSGDLEPSRDDLDLTRRLVRGGQVIGVDVLDHFIFTCDGRWISLRTSRSDLFSA